MNESEQVTEPRVPVTGPVGPHAQDQSDERLPWPRLVRFAALALGLFTLAGIAAVVVLYDESGRISDDPAISARHVRDEQLGIVEPRLIELETRAQRQREAKKAELNGWGWVDREQNRVHMPIERAMQLVAEGQR